MALLPGPGVDPTYKVEMGQIAFVNSEQVTPSDTDTFPLSYIHFGGAGTVSYRNSEGLVVTYGSVNAGDDMVCLATGIMAAETTATPITRHW